MASGFKGFLDWVGYPVGKPGGPAGFHGLLDWIGYPVGVSGGGTDADATPAGVEMVASVGQATASAVVPSGGIGSWAWHPRDEEYGEERVSVTVFPRGVSATVRIGRATATGEASVTVTGVEMVAANGDAIARAEGLASLVGVSVDVFIGEATAWDVHVVPVDRYASIDAVALPRGLLASVAVGFVHADGTDTIDRAWSQLQTDEDELLILGVIA